MLTKSILSAAIALGFAATLQAPAAEAKTNVDIAIGIGIGAGYHGPGFIGGGIWFDDPRISCSKARRIVERSGFGKINTTDCSAPNYGFTGWKAGQKFSIRVNHWGNITRVQAI